MGKMMMSRLHLREGGLITLIILMLVVGWPNRKHLVGRSSMIVDNYSCLAA